jgi:Mrp family chromosome partitioning ATPase
MEKLQAALARAREKRDGGEPMRTVRPELSARAKSRKVADIEAIDWLWREIPLFEPSPQKMQQSRIFSSDASHDASHFDILRTKLMLEMRRNNWTRIAITSATSGCGKTTMACNLIAGLGRQPEVRGILFDLDLRRPSVSKFFGASPVASLTDVLEDKVPFAEQAMRLDTNTAISMTTRSVRDPAKLILRQHTAEVLDDIQAVYRPDIMLFDLPPVLVSDETRGFLKLVDGVLIVAGAETSTIAQIDECEREIAQYSSVAGIVFNKCRHMEEGYGYSY